MKTANVFEYAFVCASVSAGHLWDAYDSHLTLLVQSKNWSDRGWSLLASCREADRLTGLARTRFLRNPG